MKNLKTYEEINWLKKNDKSLGGDNQLVRNIMNKIETSFDMSKISKDVVDFYGGYGDSDNEGEIFAYTYRISDNDTIYSYKGKVYINDDKLDVTKDLAKELEGILKQKVKSYKKDKISNRYNNYRAKYGYESDITAEPGVQVEDTSTFDSYKYRRKYQ